MSDSEKKVKCAECGYLGLRHVLSGRTVTASLEYRKTAYNPSLSIGGYDHVYEDFPLCFRGVVNFRDKEEAGPSRDQEKCRAAIQRDRDCGECSEWEGLDPKDHYEMTLREEIMRRQDNRDDQSRLHNWLSLSVAVVAVLSAVFGPALANKLSPPPTPTVNVNNQIPATAPIESAPMPEVQAAR